MCYASVNALEDDEALALAAEAGCRTLFVGFESIDPDALREMRKLINLKHGPYSYPAMIRNAQRHGLLVVGEIVVGTDHDTPDSLVRTAAFIENAGLDLVRLQILQPLPGTGLFNRLQQEGRLLIADFPNDWKLLAQDFVMGVHYKTKQISRQELQRWVVETGTRFYESPRILARLPQAARRSRSLMVPVILLFSSLRSRKTYRNFVVRETT
jgi:radical SAM superfamily enzyme YgiQ (UPF0313 family)